MNYCESYSALDKYNVKKHCLEMGQKNNFISCTSAPPLCWYITVLRENGPPVATPSGNKKKYTLCPTCMPFFSVDFYSFNSFVCAYNVWVISTPFSPTPCYQAETILPLSLILLKREYNQ
jgi:hypothetical protein